MPCISFRNRIHFLWLHDFYSDKVNHGPIKFEPRSAVSDDTRSKLMDVFDGVKSPWLFPGVNRIFIPYHHYHHRHGDTRSAERRGDVITSKLFDVLNPEVPVPLEVGVGICFCRC